LKLQSDIRINRVLHKKGSIISWWKIYPFFLLHALAFGASGFAMAYGPDPAPAVFLYLHGGIAILSYILLYRTIFGPEEIKWMFINAALGLFGIYCQIDWILSLFGTAVQDYPFSVHVIPFLYYILYTFLIRQALLDLTRARDNTNRRHIVERLYIAISAAFYTFLYFS